MTRFGFQIPGFRHGGATTTEMFDHTLDHALAAERSGFESVWVMDHFWQLPALGGPDEPILEAYTLLGALAARTERVRLGTLVTGVTYRNPALLAKMVTTLDVISQGPRDPRDRRRVVRGRARRLRLRLPGARRTARPPRGGGADLPRDVPRRTSDLHRARTTRRNDARNVPAPMQPGGVPIMIGGSGERRTLRLVAQYADMCNVTGGPATIAPQARRPAHPLHRRRSRPVGDHHDPTRHPRADPEQRRDRPRATFLGGMAGDAFGEQFTVGEADDVVQQVDELVATGIDCLIFNMPLSDPDTVARAGELLTSNFA